MLLFAPMLVALALIAAQAVLTVGRASRCPRCSSSGSPVIALLLAVVVTGLVGRASVGTKRIEKSIVKGFQDGGQIFVLTGIGGSLAAVISEGDLGDVLQGYFQATTFAPLLVVWGIAAVLHIAVGSVSISAITAAGLLAPIAPTHGNQPGAAGPGGRRRERCSSSTSPRTPSGCCSPCSAKPPGEP